MERIGTGNAKSMSRTASNEKLKLQKLAKNKIHRILERKHIEQGKTVSARYGEENFAQAERKNVSTKKKGKVVRINKQS